MSPQTGPGRADGGGQGVPPTEVETRVMEQRPVYGGVVEETMVDADRFLALTQRLRAARDRIEVAKVPASRRSTWHERLIAIADDAQVDLTSAEAHLERFEAELDRHL